MLIALEKSGFLTMVDYHALKMVSILKQVRPFLLVLSIWQSNNGTESNSVTRTDHFPHVYVWLSSFL